MKTLSRGLRSKLTLFRKKSGLTLKHQASGIASVIDVALPSERFREAEVEESALSAIKVSEVTDEKPPEEEDGEENEEGIINDGEVGDMNKSTFAALKFFRERGDLDGKLNKIETGRNNDDKFHTRKENVDEDDGLTLEHRDKSGRLMTKKQAFRYMCWGFHNKRPSKIKQAKMEKKMKSLETVNFAYKKV